MAVQAEKQEELPALIAARDKAVTAAKRKQLQKETAEIRGHVAKNAEVGVLTRLV